MRHAGVVLIGVMVAVLVHGAPRALAQDDAPVVRFNLNGAPYDQVLDVIARQTGLPVIRQTPVPDATMTFISPDEYGLDDAVEVVNLVFATHGVRLEQDERFLYLRKIEDAARRPSAVVSPEQLEGMRPGEFASVLIPLDNAIASAVAERLQPLVSAPGTVVAVDTQNLLVVVETAAQCRRIADLVARIDAERPADIGFGLYPLTHTEAPGILASLTELVPERDQLVTIDNNKQPQVYDDVSKPALKLSADERLNAIVAVGPPARLKVVEDLVAMLDVEEAGGGDGRQTRTFSLVRLDADRAARDLAGVFEGERRRPVIRGFRDARKLVVVASSSQMARIEQVLAELDPGSGTGNASVFVETRVIDVRAVEAAALAEELAGLIEGSPELAGLPAPDIRVIERSNALVVTADERTHRVVSELARRLDRVDRAPALAWRAFELEHASAAELAPVIERAINDRARWPEDLRRAAQSGMTPRPVVRADNASNMVRVEAPEALLEIAASVVGAYDTAPARAAVEVRVFRLAEGDANAVAGAVRPVLDGDVRPGEPRPTVSSEQVSNTLVVSGSARAVGRAEELVAAMDERVEVEGVGVRTIVLEHARAAAVAPIVERLLAEQSVVEMVPAWLRWQMVWELERRGREVNRAPVQVEADERLNAVVVSAPLGVLDLAAEIVQSLDVAGREGGPGRVVDVMPLVHADARSVADAAQAAFADEDGAETPPAIRVEASSNSVVVRGTRGQLDEIRSLVSALDRAAARSSTGVRTITLDPTRMDAGEAARAIKRRMERRGGVRIEVITPEQLLETESDADEPIRGPGAHATPWAATLMLGVVAQNVGKATARPEDADGDEESELPVVRVLVDPETNSITVEGSDRVAGRIESLVRDMQRRAPGEPTAVRIVQLPEGVNPDAVTSFVTQTVRQLGRAGQGNPGGFTGRVAVSPDRTSGSLVVWSNDRDFETVRDLIAGLSRVERAVALTVKIYPLENGSANRARGSLNALINPRQGAGRRAGPVEVTVPDGEGGQRSATIDPSRITVTTDPTQTALIVSAPADQLGVVDAFVEMIDKSPVIERLAIRRYELEHAQARALQRTMQTVFDAQRQGPLAWEQARARFVADDRSNALLVTATSAQHEEIAKIIASADQSLDSEVATALEILRVDEGRPSDIARVISQVLVGRDPAKRDLVRISAQDQSGLLVVRAPAEELEEIRSLTGELDRARDASFPVRSIKLERADAQSVAAALQRFFRDRSRIERARGVRSGAGDAAIVGDRRSGTVVVSASDEDFEQIQALVERLDAPAEGREFRYRIIALEHVRVSDIAQTVQSIAGELQWERSGWFRGNRGGDNQGDRVYVETNERTNSVVIFGQGDTYKTIEKIIAELDQPGSDLGETIVRAVRAPGVDLNAVATTIENLTATPGWRWWQGRDPNAVGVEVDRRRNVLILVGKKPVVEESVGYVEEIVAGGMGEGEVVEIVALAESRATELQRSLQNALPEGLGVRVTAVSRTNSLLLTGAREDIELVKAQVAALDKAPERAPLEFRRFALKNADANDLSFVLRQLVRNRPRGRDEPAPGIDALLNQNTLAVTASAEEMAFIAEMVDAFDVARESGRRTEFVKLEFADAEQTSKALRVFYGRTAMEATTSVEREVSIVPDPASNSLVISAAESTWEGIRDLLVKLDTEEYDTSQQLVVLPLKHASATSVARALNEGFRAPLEDQLDRERVRLEAQRRGNNGRDRDYFEPTVLVESEGVPVVSAEQQTNSLIVFAGRKELDRIRQIVAQLDVADYLELPPARVVPVRAGRASQIASAAERVFVTDEDRDNPRRVRIVGDDASAAVIVRSEDEQFGEIAAFIAQLETRALESAPRARVVRVANIPAARVVAVLNRTLQPLAQQRGERLTVEVERTTNALVIGASDEVFEEAAALIRSLDGAGPDAGNGGVGAGGFGHDVTMVRVERTSPRAMVSSLQAMGVTRGQPADRPGVVSEPVGLVPIDAAGAVAVIGTGRDTRVIERLIGVLDGAQVGGEQAVAVVALKLARADAVAQRLRQMLVAGRSDSDAGPADALAEQVRRLRLRGADNGAIELDLDEPVRVIADGGSNAVILASSAGNVAALERVVALLDRLPIGDAVTVRIFPLENASADRVRSLVEQLFRQGARVRRTPGTSRVGMPTTAAGRALAGEIAVVVDERTNALVVSGSEQSLALVEVLIDDLDAPGAERGWLETALIEVEHADAVTLAEKLRRVLVDGLGETPEAVALRRQIGRLRVMPNGQGGAGQETELFAPLAGVVIEADADLNAVIVVATPTNVRAVRSLVGMLDVERAAASNAVRVVPLVHAEAGRVARIVEETFDERSRLPSSRAEDRVSVSVDERSNALVVSTSRRSFEILEGLIESLDQPEARFAVGLHVVPVPGADVASLAPRVERLMTDRLRAMRVRGARESAQDVFSVEADPAAGVLIIASSEENLELVRELIDSLTGEDPIAVGAAPGETTSLVQLDSPGSAQEIADAIDELYVQPQVERRGARAVTVVPNERLNALLVTGSAEDIEQVRALAERLDGAEVGLVEEVRRVALDAASAVDTVNLVEDVLAGRSLSGRQGAARATRIRVFTERLEDAEATIDGDIREQITLTPDRRTNSVLIKAPPDLMGLIVALVQDLDDETRGDRVIEAFRLVNGDALQMQEVLVDLFNLQQRGDRFVLAPSREREDDSGTIGEQAFSAIPDERQELSVTVDRRTNTLLVSGTPELIGEVRRVVESLDAIEATERERLVFHLRNAQAAEIEQTLQAYFSGEADLLRTTLGPQLSGSVLRQLEQEVTVVGDPNSNKLVISASPRYIDAVQKIVEELDSTPPQVMIEVLIAEVTLDASEEFGLDIAIGGTVATTSGDGLSNQVGGSSIGGDGFVFDALASGTGVATALGVPNLAVGSTDFGLLIRALQSQGKLEVLSRPQVQVNDNEEAQINVGEEIAITSGVERRENFTTAIVERRDVGINLRVLPSISSDGYVRLDISPSISLLSDRTTQIDENFEAPIITQREVNTTVTIKDGETVVIGGLIQTSDSEIRTKTPLLGDIPLVGGLFRSQEQNQIKTELLVILTPHVIPGDRDGISTAIQRELFERSLNSLEDRSAVDGMLELGDIPASELDTSDRLYDEEWENE